MSSKKILFVLHEASESGAPKVLYNFLLWLKQNTEAEFDILLLHNGELSEKLRGICNQIFVLPPNVLRIRQKLKKIFFNKKISPFDPLRKTLVDRQYDVLYFNSVFSLKHSIFLNDCVAGAKKILHLHEGEFLSRLYFDGEQGLKSLSFIDQIIAVSHISKKNFVRNYNFPEKKITVVYPYPVMEFNENKQADREEIKKDLNISENDFVLGMMGNPHLIKGSDLLPVLGLLLKKKYPSFKFKFLIIGGHAHNLFSISGKLDVQKLMMKDHFIFIPHQENVNKFFKVIDLYTLLSREESFSLMAVEASLHTTPVITFRDNGGPNEILSDDNAFFVDYLDLDALAQKIYELSGNKTVLENTAVKARHNFENKIMTENPHILMWKILNNS